MVLTLISILKTNFIKEYDLFLKSSANNGLDSLPRKNLWYVKIRQMQ